MQPKLQPRWFLTRGHKENGIWLLSFTDIDCYKRREEALTHNYVIAELGNSRYETIKSSGFTGMFVVQVEPPRKFVEVNDTFCKLLGYTRDELVGKMSWQDLTPQEYEETDNHQEEKMKQTGSSSSFEKVYITKSKKRIYVLVAGIILPKEPDLCLAIVSDVTAQKEAEKAALEATQAKSMFLANVSHEIRTPMHGICASLELLKETPIDENQSELVDIVKNSSDNLMTLISDILDFSKIEAGKLKIEEAPMNVQSIVEDTISLLTESSNLKKISLLYNVDLKFPVIGDPGRFRQVLVNLVGNAIKFTEQGFVKVDISVISEEPSRALIKCKVSDSGIGIAEELHKFLFIPFSQVGHTSTTKRFGGTGLGLAICKQIVQYFGGEIGVNSKPDVGSTFWFTMVLKKTSSFSVPQQEINENLNQNLKICSLDSYGVERETMIQWFRQWKVEITFFVSMEDAFQQRSLFFQTSCSTCAIEIILVVWTEQSCKKISEFFEKSLDRPKNIGILLVGFPVETLKLFPQGIMVSSIPKPAKRNKMLQMILQMTNPKSLSTTTLMSTTSNDSILASVTKRQKHNRVTIMIAEDNVINQKVLLRQLEKLGFSNCLIAKNGREALELYDKTDDLSLIFMDVQMPEMDGLTCTMEIRSKEKFTGKIDAVPIIALTANTLADTVSKCISAGCTGYQSKPMNIAQLKVLLEKYLPATNKSLNL